MIRRAIIFLILFSCSSCTYYYSISGRNYYRIQSEENGRTIVRPKHSNFKLALPAPYILKEEDSIDTKVIYIKRSSLLGNEQIRFLRFFDNGRLISGCLREDSLQYNRPKSATIGYYRMRNSNELEMQEFIAHSSAYASYEYSRAIIRKDTIFLFPYAKKKEKLPTPLINYKEWNGKKISNCAIYIKQKVDTLTGTPDW